VFDQMLTEAQVKKLENWPWMIKSLKKWRRNW
jgi:hypothetical protein